MLMLTRKPSGNGHVASQLQTSMNITEAVRMALRALAANKLRSALTMLGIIIGVGAVITLLSVGKGVQTLVTEQLAEHRHQSALRRAGQLGSGWQAQRPRDVAGRA